MPNVDVESKAVYTNNPTSGAMRGFGTNQAHFAMEGIMDILAERIGVDGYDIRERNILNPGDAFATGQIMRPSVRGLRETLAGREGSLQRLEICRDWPAASRAPASGTARSIAGTSRFACWTADRVQVLNGYTEMGQGVYTATQQAVCEETGLPPEKVGVIWDKEMGSKCGETWASRATTLSCAAAQSAARKLAADLKQAPLEQLAGREYTGDYVCDFTAKPGTPEALKNPTTHLTFSYSTQVVILDEDGRLERVIAAHDVGRAINPRLCAEQMEGGVHMGLGYALSENFPSTNGVPNSLLLRDLGILRAKETPQVDVILIEVPDEVGGYGSKGVGEIGCVATAGAVASALYSYDKIRRFSLPMESAPAAAPSLPKSRRKAVAAEQRAGSKELPTSPAFYTQRMEEASKLVNERVPGEIVCDYVACR